MTQGVAQLSYSDEVRGTTATRRDRCLSDEGTPRVAQRSGHHAVTGLTRKDSYSGISAITLFKTAAVFLVIALSSATGIH
jgi:hypothetical protein